MPSYKSNRGEMMIEVLIALLILIVGAFGALRLLGVAGINNQITQERVIATNLAREGIEAVRNIRDTNWLRFAGERRICWNNLNTTACDDTNTDVITDEPIIGSRPYAVYFDATSHRWRLSPDGIGNTDRLDITDGDLENDAPYRLQIDPTTGLYNRITGADKVDSIYYREIYTEYLDKTQTVVSDAGANILRVTCKVQWYDRGKISQVILTTILTDYLGRQNHD